MGVTKKKRIFKDAPKLGKHCRDQACFASKEQLVTVLCTEIITHQKHSNKYNRKMLHKTEICIFGETLNCLSVSICFKSQHVYRFNIPWIQHRAHICHLFKDLVGHCVGVDDYSEILYIFLYLCWNGLVHIDYLVLSCSCLEHDPVCALKATM